MFSSYEIFTVAFGNAASLSIASTSDAPMYVVVNTRSERPRASQCRSISVRNFSKPLSLMNAHKRSTESALSNSLRRCSSNWSPSALTIRLEAWSDPRGRSGACAGLATIAVSRSAFRRSSSSRSKTRGACEPQHRQQRFRQCEPLSGVSLQFGQCEGEPIPEQRFEHRADRLAHGERGTIHFERSAKGRQLAIKTCTDDLVGTRQLSVRYAANLPWNLLGLNTQYSAAKLSLT